MFAALALTDGAALACASLRVSAFYRSTMLVVSGIVPAAQRVHTHTTLHFFPMHSEASGKKEIVYHLPSNMQNLSVSDTT